MTEEMPQEEKQIPFKDVYFTGMVMSKTQLNKHVHAIELLNRYVAEISSLFAEDLEAVLNTSLPNEEQL